MYIKGLAITLAILCALLVCGFAAALLSMLKYRRQITEKQSHFTNFDRLTGLGNKAKFTADDASGRSLDACAMISVHLSRYMELYNLFGVAVSDEVVTEFCHSLVAFARERDGQAYRVAFNHVVMIVHMYDKPIFLDELKVFMLKSEKLDIVLANAKYKYDFLLLYGVYFLSNKDDKGTDLSKILIELDRSILHSTMKSADECVVIDGIDKPDWIQARELFNDAPAAWDNHEFSAYYQPIVNIYTGKVVGSEILARWQHPKYGLILPNQFVPILEASGLIINLDLYMIEEACKKIQYWLNNGILTVPLAINLSALDIHRTDFIDKLVALVSKYDIPPILLELELPEHNLLFEDNADFIKLMNNLRKKGFSLSMGHFAEMDNASVWLLRKLPLDIIKVDYHFFENAHDNERSDIYVRNFLNLAKQLNIKIVVTQLETEERVKHIQSFGCTNGKGFYFSKPLSTDEFQAFII